MKYEDYQSLYIGMLELDPGFVPVDIPIDPLPGESIGDVVLRFMVEQEMITVEGDEFFMSDRQKIEDYDPNLLKILDSIAMAYAMAELDELEEQGLMFTTVDENGAIVYEMTELGRATLEDN